MSRLEIFCVILGCVLAAEMAALIGLLLPAGVEAWRSGLPLKPGQTKPKRSRKPKSKTKPNA